MTKTLFTKFLLCALTPAVCAFPAWGQGAPRGASPQNAPLADSLRKTVKMPGPDADTAMRKFERRTGTKGWKVRYSPKTAMPEAIVGGRTNRYPGSPADAALAFLNENRELLKIDAAQLRPAYSKTFMGVTHLQYDQVYNSIPVEFAYVRVHVNASGEVTGCQSKFEPVIDVPLTPAYPLIQAESVALAALGFPARVTRTQLVLFPDPAADGALKLAWKIRTRASATGNGLWIYYIGAADGSVLFRYNDLRYAVDPATGNVRGLVYPISPLPTGEGSWISPLDKPINNQYVWVTNTLAVSSHAVTDANGDYASSYDGKVFASLKGPYFSVVNFLGPSAHFDNGGGVWTPYYHIPGVGGTSTSDNSYSLSIPQSHWPAGAFAKVLPHFSSFNVGAMDNDGNFSNNDELHVLDGSSVVASYIGARTAPFFGAPVENSAYGLALDKRSGSQTPASFAVDYSSYLVLTNAPTVSDNAAGAINWVSTGTRVSIEPFGNAENSQAEVNVFYHLNMMHDYFGFVNKNPNPPFTPPADLSSKQVPVMVHAYDTSVNIGNGGLRNAFYDLEQDNIFIGDGSKNGSSKYLSFALDGTIIRHEYVHRVINQIYPIINIGEFGALSEAMADYFALSSLDNREGNGAITVLGNFVGSPRDISGTTAIMPDSWNGEVHDDSLILSQALWTLKRNPGIVGNYAAFPGVDRVDVLTYASLFYFPDNFANFHDAMVDACRQLGGGTCAYEATINAAFAAHGIPAYSGSGDAYDQPVAGTMCDNNNGPECATDLSQISSLSATIFPKGDADFYSIPLSKGNFTATLILPAADSNFQAYAIGLFDSARNHVADVTAAASNSGSGDCPLSGVCLTNERALVLSQSIGSPGRYYLVVTGGNGETFSSAPYSLTVQYMSTGSAQAGITRAVFDGDNVSFSVPYARFRMSQAPSSATLTGAESVFQYAQLRDGVDHHPLLNTRTDMPGSYLIAGAVTQTESGYIQGNASLSPGFNARYPAVGEVCLEVFGRNHMGATMSLGISNNFSLAANQCEIITYNNVLTGDNPSPAVIRYDLQSPGDLTISIYTVAGTLVKTLFDGNITAPGKGRTDWDGKNENGSKVASGIYYVKASGPCLNKVDKIAVVR